jgi:hypothetical protein
VPGIHGKLKPGCGAGHRQVPIPYPGAF